MKDNNKPQRPRKPCGAIRCTMNINTPPSVEKESQRVDMGKLGSFKRQPDGSVKFEEDPSGIWRVIEITDFQYAQNL